MAKLRRKRRALEGRNGELFEAAAGAPLNDVLALLKRSTVDEAAGWFGDHGQVAEFLDRVTGGGPKVYVSDHADNLKRVAHGYGEGRERPEDYLEGFGRFIRENLNKLPALNVVLQRPRELTRQRPPRPEARARRRPATTRPQLQTAWRDLKNEDIAASIIGFIRQQALGEPLRPVRRARGPGAQEGAGQQVMDATHSASGWSGSASN